MGATTSVTPVVGVAARWQAAGPPFTAGESWLTMKAAEHPPAGPTAQPHCHLIAHHESQATIQATNFVMPKQSSALPGRKAAVGATRAGDGTGSGNPVGTAPLAPSAGGVLEAWMPGPQDSPVLVIGALAVLRLAWGFCCVWLERSRRKTTLAIMDKLLAWECERKKLDRA